jgi:WD40 repeat protein
MVKAISFSSDGRQLALGCEDGRIEVLEWPSGRRLVGWQGSPLGKAIRNIDFSWVHEDRLLTSVDESGACNLWSAAEGLLLMQLQPPKGSCVCARTCIRVRARVCVSVCEKRINCQPQPGHLCPLLPVRL